MWNSFRRPPAPVVSFLRTGCKHERRPETGLSIFGVPPGGCRAIQVARGIEDRRRPRVGSVISSCEVVKSDLGVRAVSFRR